MTGIGWHISVFGAIIISLTIIIYRTINIVRLPVHLRWQLAPIPHEKRKSRYGGSYLEEYEWWRQPRRRSRIAPLVYMAKEILLLRGVCKHNMALWPLTLVFHLGIYLIAAMLLFCLINAILIIAEVPLSVLNVFLGITSVLAMSGYLLGSLGTIGLLIKRILDSNFRPFNTVSTYFRLVFLGAVFISGFYVWFLSGDFAFRMSLFVSRLITLDSGVSAAFPLSLHIIISLLFILYLPLTNMIHFVAKYFTYFEIRWNDRPKDEKMEEELAALLAQPVNWSATHVKAGDEKSWTDIMTG
jgi:nitrate reductase gamma subunit